VFNRSLSKIGACQDRLAFWPWLNIAPKRKEFAECRSEMLSTLNASLFKELTPYDESVS
jgi:hypothetical protein